MKRTFLILSVSILALSWVGGIIFYRWWSDNSVNFSDLELLLQKQKWSEADAETANLLLKLSRRDFLQLYYINPRLYDFANVPCKDLERIDMLWLEHSNKRFGLSIRLADWNNRVSDLNWTEYRRDPNSEDAKKRWTIINGIQEQSDRLISTNYSNPHTGQLPSENWIFTATQAGEDPVLTAKNFYQRLEDCELPNDPEL